ncbi:hypothetical protein ACFV4N_18775 [Actinosynnema sp. NPDC059797]
MSEVPEDAVLTTATELLYRQVHPTQMPNGTMSSEAFNPSARDKDLLSTLREHVGPEEAYRRWTETNGFLSVGTYAVSVGEVDDQGLQAIDDAATTEPDHASIDYTSAQGKSERKRRSRKLRDAAVARGCLHRPHSP